MTRAFGWIHLDEWHVERARVDFPGGEILSERERSTMGLAQCRQRCRAATDLLAGRETLLVD